MPRLGAELVLNRAGDFGLASEIRWADIRSPD